MLCLIRLVALRLIRSIIVDYIILLYFILFVNPKCLCNTIMRCLYLNGYSYQIELIFFYPPASNWARDVQWMSIGKERINAKDCMWDCALALPAFREMWRRILVGERF